MTAKHRALMMFEEKDRLAFKGLFHFSGGWRAVQAMLCLVFAMGVNANAQEVPAKGAPSNPKGIPTSSRSVPSLEATNSSLRDLPSTGWIQFDKCPVFALESIELPTQETGVIAALEVAENDAIEANQSIIRMDSKTAELEKGVVALQVQVANAEAQDDSEVRLAEAFVEEAQLQLDMYEEMTNKGTASSTDLRQRQLALSQAKVRLTQSKANRVQKELKAKLAQSSLVLSQQKLDRMALKSPFAGTVTRIHHRPGEWVQAGTALLTIIRINELRVDCFVDLDQLDPVRFVGTPVKVIAKRGTQESLFAGKISSYDSDVSSAGKIRVHATVQNQKVGEHWLLLPGMSVSMRMQKP